MFQRSGAHASIRIATHQQQPSSLAAPTSDSEMTEFLSATAAPGGRTPLTKKLLLTLLVLVQVCFISCLWLLQIGGGLNASTNEVAVLNEGKRNMAINTKPSALSAMPHAAALHGMRRVNFITKTTVLGLTETVDRNEVLNHDLSPPVIGNSQSGKVSNFRKDFYLKTNRLNKTIELRNGTSLVPELDNDAVWCFREGSIDEFSQLSNDDDAQNDALSWEEDTQCKCRAGWHGRDCGQPEVMWRALLTAKSHFRLQQPSETQNVNQLVYLLEGNFFNLDLLQLQIQILADIVDYFVIFVRPARKDIKMLEHWLRETLAANKYLIFQCDTRHVLEANCTTAQAYAYFRQQLKRKQRQLELKPTDLLLYTGDRVLPSLQALQFLKYYATDVRTVPFRLKFVVYGFYWQHPKQTHLSGLISSFVHVDNPSQLIDGGGRNPVKILQRILTESSQPPPFVIGDLNHFGGWFCKYCQQPEEIVAELHAESNATRQVQFPDAVRSHNIDVAYLQKLIATGIYVDGKTQLIRNRRYSDKYYAPPLAETENAKYGNLLVNLYESFDDDIEYEAGDY
ncbi:uncharacterized protein LOC128864963 [Anastrepha ludens]|uniref:uncharacterized protein LOC128864963 n=1 Tax=Anastrepha ludens TaxID=28586 RepID=UPI0023AF769E|nr:uncharacterized protein LOC128864963 [Anastrepha ludens]